MKKERLLRYGLFAGAFLSLTLFSACGNEKTINEENVAAHNMGNGDQDLLEKMQNETKKITIKLDDINSKLVEDSDIEEKIASAGYQKTDDTSFFKKVPNFGNTNPAPRFPNHFANYNIGDIGVPNGPNQTGAKNCPV